MNINRIKKNIKKVEEIVESIDVQDVINRMEKDKENSIEEDIKILESIIKINNDYLKGIENQTINQKEIKALEHILSDYKRVLKENEELKQDRNNNYQMIALAQNEALGYMQGYEDGKKLKRSAVANIVENQQYYIFNKQIEHYKEYIEKLQKENEKALAEYMEWQKQELEQKNKIIEQMTYYIMNLDIDEDICKKVNCDTNSGELDCKDCIKQYFENKAKEINKWRYI